MPEPFSFTEATVAALPTPASGRIYHKDDKLPGLQLCLTAAGARTYYFVRRIDGKPTRYRLGTTAELSVKTARSPRRQRPAKSPAERTRRPTVAPVGRSRRSETCTIIGCSTPRPTRSPCRSTAIV